MTRDRLIAAISKFARSRLVSGYYVTSDDGEPWDNPDFCREHAEQVVFGQSIITGVDWWISSTSMGADGHRECAFVGCNKHLNLGGLTDYGLENALGLTEPDPRKVSCYPSELELAACALSNTDPRWELWEYHARKTIAWEARHR